MIGRVRRAFGVLAPEQRYVVLAAALVFGSMLLPWYSKSLNGFGPKGPETTHEAKLAIFVPSFVEASIFLVSVALLALMFARGERKAFHLPFGDGIVVSAAGVWVGFLIFYRFIDQPAGGKTDNLVFAYDLSWGIFFGLLAAAFLIYRGTVLRLAGVPEPVAAGEGPPVAPAAASAEAPTTVAPRAVAPTAVGPVSRGDEAAERERRRAEREAARGRPPLAPEATRPEIDGGTQLSFDEQE
jgi:hypothetical protein